MICQTIRTLSFLVISWFIGTLSAPAALWPATTQPRIQNGIDCLIQSLQAGDPTDPYLSLLKHKRIGIISNHTGRTVDGDLTLKVLGTLLKPCQSNLTAIFALEHGVQGVIEASQVVTSSSTEAVDKLKGPPQVFSLYGSNDESLYPTFDMLDKVDLILYDIADVGSRCYTYASSLFYLLKCVSQYNLQALNRPMPLTVIVLDRPNPINGLMIDGPGVEEDWQSFIGVFDIPMCHGMTIGELALLYNQTINPTPAPLQVIPLQGWKRSGIVDLKALCWTPSSPNIPTLEATRLYPITVIGEGLTFLNIGKGTQQPFHYLVAPHLDGYLWAQAANQLLAEGQLQGVRISDYAVVPSAPPYAGLTCQGIRVEVLDPRLYKPIATQYVILEALQNTHHDFLKTQLCSLYAQRQEASRLHVGKALSNYHQACWLAGSDQLLKALAAGDFRAHKAIQAYTPFNEWFLSHRKPYLLYP